MYRKIKELGDATDWEDITEAVFKNTDGSDLAVQDDGFSITMADEFTGQQMLTFVDGTGIRHYYSTNWEHWEVKES